jgi:hypothetical protein
MNVIEVKTHNELPPVSRRYVGTLEDALQRFSYPFPHDPPAEVYRWQHYWVIPVPQKEQTP